MDGYGRSLWGLAFRLEPMGSCRVLFIPGPYHYHLASMLLGHVHRGLPIHARGVCGTSVASSHVQ